MRCQSGNSSRTPCRKPASMRSAPTAGPPSTMPGASSKVRTGVTPERSIKAPSSRSAVANSVAATRPTVAPTGSAAGAASVRRPSAACATVIWCAMAAAGSQRSIPSRPSALPQTSSSRRRAAAAAEQANSSAIGWASARPKSARTSGTTRVWVRVPS